MRTRRQILAWMAVIVVLASFMTFVAVPQARALANPLKSLNNNAVVVPASDGTPIALGADTQFAFSCQVPTDAAACIRVGGSAVTASTGLQFGPASL